MQCFCLLARYCCGLKKEKKFNLKDGVVYWWPAAVLFNFTPWPLPCDGETELKNPSLEERSYILPSLYVMSTTELPLTEKLDRSLLIPHQGN